MLDYSLASLNTCQHNIQQVNNVKKSKVVNIHSIFNNFPKREQLFNMSQYWCTNMMQNNIHTCIYIQGICLSNTPQKNRAAGY